MPNQDNLESLAREGRPKPSRLRGALFLAATIAILLAAGGIILRAREGANLAESTKKRATPSVRTVAAEVGAGAQTLVLPGDVRAFTDARIRARINGYVRDWNHDIGARVKAGDVLATIDAPDLNRQLDQARSELARAQAQGRLAQLTSNRWAALRSSAAVSQQSADEKSGESNARSAEVAAASANAERLKTLQNFAQLVAPFDGVVTARNVDVGALVGPDEKKELFSVSDIHQMRIYVGVPQSYAAAISKGMSATLKLSQYPHRTFDAKVLTTSNAIDEKSRTLLVQLIADNPDGALLPGSYAEVNFMLPGNAKALRLPANTILYRDNRLNVATIGPDHKVAIKPIEVARDLGTMIEIESGVAPTDRIIENPPEFIRDGDEVRIADDDPSRDSSEPKRSGAD